MLLHSAFVMQVLNRSRNVFDITFIAFIACFHSIVLDSGAPYDDGSIANSWVDIAQAFVQDELKW